MLSLSYADYQAIRAHGEETYPHECCGILLGTHAAGNEPTASAPGAGGNVVRRVLRAGNTRTDSAHNRYHIAPEELVRAQREGRRDGLDIVGFYHSHPDHPAQWSATDFAEAHWIGCSYVITAVENVITSVENVITAVEKGHATVTNSFLLQGSDEESKVFVDEALEIDVTGVDDRDAKLAAEQSIQVLEGEIR